MARSHCNKCLKRLVLTVCLLSTPYLLLYKNMLDETRKGIGPTQTTVSIIDNTNYLPAVRCNSAQLPVNITNRDKMQSVGAMNSTLLYSAFYEVDQPKVVRIIAVCYRHTKLPYYCQVWYNSRGHMTMVITEATFFLLADHKFSMRVFTPCNITCLLPVKQAPLAVSVVLHQHCTVANNLVKIEQIGIKRYTRNFTMCLSALHSKYDDAKQLVEWIEFNKILGANHFLIYEYSSGKNVKRVLEHYKKQGLVEVIQWLIPFKSGPIVHYYGQTSTYNDCLMRIKSRSKYIVISDLDEFLVPHKEGIKTWIDMIKFLPQADSYLFRNCFFPVSHGYDDIDYPEKQVAKKYSIQSLLSLKRHTRIWPPKTRSKYIARTATTDCLFTHFQLGGRNHSIDPTIGLLHHFKKDWPFRQQSITDKTVLTKYGNDITYNVARAWKEIDNN